MRLARDATVLVLSTSRVVGAFKGRPFLEDVIDPISTESIAACFEKMTRETRCRDVRLLLAPDLCEVRLIALPPLNRERATKAVAREAARHFLTAVVPQAVDVTSIGPASVAACASTELMERIEEAALRARVRLQRVGSCYEAWSRAGSNTEQWIQVTLPLTIELLLVRKEEVLELRRFPRSRTDLLNRVLESSPIPLVTIGGTEQGQPNDPFLDAAMRAGHGGLSLMSDHHRAKRARLRRRAAARQFAAALAFILVAAGLERWGLERELTNIERFRTSIHPQAASALTQWSTVEKAIRNASDIAALEDQRTSLATTLALATRQLPEGVRLLAFRAQQDTMTMEIAAPDALAALEAFKERRLFANLRLIGSVQRREQSDGSIYHQFEVAAAVSEVGGAR